MAEEIPEASTLERDGFQIVSSVLAPTEIEAFRAALGSIGGRPGHRQLANIIPEVATLASSSRILKLLHPFTAGRAFPVRSIFFDKTAENNWLVPWHQDLSVAVRSRINRPGYGPWSMKDGIAHVQPPKEIMESMITMRLHLDDTDESNGGLRVLPGSHRAGRLSATDIANVRSSTQERTCCLRAGDGLLMKPLLLHASSAAVSPTRRRVIHIEYATRPLAAGLEWFLC